MPFYNEDNKEAFSKEFSEKARIIKLLEGLY